MKYSIAKLLLVISTALTINAIVLERSYDPDYKGMGHGGGDYDDDYDSNGHGRRKKYGDDYDGNGRGRRRYDGDDYDGHGHGRKKHGNDYDGRKKFVTLIYYLQMKYSVAKLLLVISAVLAINTTVLECSYDPDYKGVGHGGGGGDYDDEYDAHDHGTRRYGGGGGGDYDDY
ncbi:hypothetical protein K493DRAFT_346678 [Basidiobolus meristosporus CBS 931.73]|uniref:Glycine-rich protein n=1 Tax=Basidiobolus meristosporus CBS 931.73 TaxID=1314790 RepID=A0A1Y1YXC7_9FUNG|nr:hypothetical protein K493DRAFT_346678 [Basidiobolus meristosporus CBS 931.73]|eukprot:ORY02534.1 hypothetical protein K493DRAFT_346678 [Basidiobolus meristosporus CBS 931.73]